MGIHPDVAHRLGASLAAYRRGEVSLADLGASVETAAGLVVTVDEAPDARFLRAAANRLELIAFTSEGDLIRRDAMRLVDELDAWARAYVD